MKSASVSFISKIGREGVGEISAAGDKRQGCPEIRGLSSAASMRELSSFQFLPLAPPNPLFQRVGQPE